MYILSKGLKKRILGNHHWFYSDILKLRGKVGIQAPLNLAVVLLLKNS